MPHRNSDNITNNKSSDHEILLYHLTRIVRELYPNRTSQNPYDLSLIKHSLSIEDQLLFKDLLHAITLLNAPSRTNEEGELISTQSDFINAMELIIPKKLLLDIKCINSHTTLLAHFGDTPFSYLEGARLLKISRPSFYRRLRPLLLQGMVIKHEEHNEKKAYFRAVNTNPADDWSQEMFEHMQGEWRDFIGYVEF